VIELPRRHERIGTFSNITFNAEDVERTYSGAEMRFVLSSTRARQNDAPATAMGSSQSNDHYARVASVYRRFRRPDERIGAALHDALGAAHTLVNVGAGTGSYEPRDRTVIAVEPSAAMLAQRAVDAAPAVQASALALPFGSGAFDAALAVLTIHHWPDWRAGIAELGRVARDRIVILTWDPAGGFWLVRDYLPHLLGRDRSSFPTLRELEAMLNAAFAAVEIVPIHIPADCTDGFMGAYWQRPAMYLDPEARAAISALAVATPETEAGLRRLERELADGTWQARYEHLLARQTLDIGYRLLVARR
jgi:SAM-dependent methyltransferase